MSAESHLDSLLAELRGLLAQGRSLDDASAFQIAQQEQQFGRWPDLLEERLDAVKVARTRILDELNRVEFLQRRTVRFGRQLWYSGPSDGAVIWNRLKLRLEEAGRTAEEVKLVDEESTTVLSLMDAPTKTAFSTRGLVVGHVQSGKTGNMAAVIAKAADTHFKFFLVLSGMTDQLRNQTQGRLLEDVVNANPERWFPWTSEDTPEVNGDFNHPALGGFSFDNRNQLAVLKKNAGILRRFLGKLRNTDGATKANTAFLIIDDECDQASVNSARYDAQITAINNYIRQIIRECPKAAYVGYTATPFANVLIDTRTDDDLYPRHFIHALQRPKAYFGAEELFGRSALDGEYDVNEDGYDMIRTVPDNEIAYLRPSGSAVDDFVFSVTPSLEAAIRYFILVIAARDARGQGSAHSTMLVHTSVRIAAHRKTADVLMPHLKVLAGRLRDEDPVLLSELASQWEEEQDRVLSEQFDLPRMEFGALRPFLAAGADDIEVHVENFMSTKRLNYGVSPRRYLVVGGNVLARGLTLYGLSVSYFLRSSSQYDTLMQMGRWFGYRSGFEDLPRVWVEESVAEMFFDLATVEAEIRREIARYAAEEVTPSEFAVRIRKIPGMTITAKAKMRHAVDVEIGYDGEHVQTFRFRRNDAAWLGDNWAAGTRLVEAASWQGVGPHSVATGVHVARILEFVTAYRSHGSHKQLAPEFLGAFIRQSLAEGPDLSVWNLVVVGGEGRQSALPLGRLGRVRTVVRSAVKDSGDDASIKALMSRSDLLIDLNERAAAGAGWGEVKKIRYRAGAPPLLLLYPIEAESRPVRDGENREPLAAVADVLGMGIVFPGESAAGATYVAANLQPDDAVDEVADSEDPVPPEAFAPTAGGPEV